MSHSQYNPTGVAGNAGQSRSVRPEASDGIFYCKHPGCTRTYSRFNAYTRHLEAPHEDNNIVSPLLIVPRTAIDDPGARPASVQQSSVVHVPAVTSSSPAFNGEAFLPPVGPLERQSATFAATVSAEEEHRDPEFVSEVIPAHRGDELPVSAVRNPGSEIDLAERLMRHSSLATYITDFVWFMLMDNVCWAQYCALRLQGHQWNMVAVRNLWPKLDKTLPSDLEGLIADLRLSPDWPAIQRKFLRDYQGLQTHLYCWLHQLTVIAR